MEEDDEFHQVHCLFCITAACAQSTCRVVDCPQQCGARFHTCKMDEHNLLCLNRKLPCINSIHGCPKILPNWQRGIHLETCPASAIFCSMEWNRWPVYTDERKLYSSLSRMPVKVNCAQMDMALAMRDQRMLNRARRVPRRMKRVLRNNLTRRYPAVPIQYREGSEDEESTATSTISDDEDTLWDLAAMPPGLQRSVCTKLFMAQQKERLSKATIEELSPFSSLEDLSEPRFDVINELNGSVTCHYSVQGGHQSDSDQENEYHSFHSNDCQHIVDGENCNETGRYRRSCSEESGGGANCGAGEGCVGCGRRSGCGHTCDGFDKCSIGSGSGSCTNVGNSIADNDANNTESEAQRSRYTDNTPVASSHTVLCDLLDVDLNLEFISRYQPKPRTMYTFLCGQEFRRDEYPWHTCNVHTDIHYGLNGWFEQRCPLAQYGCTYSVRRLHPNNPHHKIIHSKLLESFGLRPLSNRELSHLKKSPSVDSYWDKKKGDNQNPKQGGKFHSLPADIDQKCRASTPEVRTSLVYEQHVTLVDRGRSLSPTYSKDSHQASLAQLPDEILRTILRYLDGFSLNCLSLTSHRMRDVCSSILHQRGIVVCDWQRSYHGNTVRWVQTNQRWMFTRAFSPVTKWRLADHLPISDHLKTCPFNTRLEHSRPELLEVRDWPGAQHRLRHTEQENWVDVW